MQFLTVSDEGDYHHDVANWAEARLITTNGEVKWLDTMKPVSARQGWGSFRQDNKSAVGGPMNVAGRPYARGLGTHAPSTLRFKLDGAFASFEATVGVDGSRKAGEGRVRFLVSETAPRKGVTESPPLIITITTNAPHFYLGKVAMTFDRLNAELTQRAKSNPRLVVALRADDQAAYGHVVKVTEAAQAAEVKEIRTFLKPGIKPE